MFTKILLGNCSLCNRGIFKLKIKLFQLMKIELFKLIRSPEKLDQSFSLA